MTGSNEDTPVTLASLSNDEDLPIGQLVRRYGERRLGVLTDDTALSGAQLRLVRDLSDAPMTGRKALGLGFPALADPARQGHQRLMSRRPLHLDVGARHLELKIDPGFGRFGVGQHQDLTPEGPWRYRLDAELLRLWLEEEIVAQGEAALSAAAATAAVTTRPPEADRPAPLRRAPAARPILERIPAPARRVLEARRGEVRQALLAAVRGDTDALARLTHGERAAALLREAQQAVETAEASTAEGSPVETPRATTALTHDHLRRLAESHPTLNVDAAARDFSFERAARQVLQAARRQAQRRAAATTRGDRAEVPSSRRPGALAAAAEQTTRRAALRAARLNADTRQIQSAIDAAALSMTPFEATSLIERTGDGSAVDEAQEATSAVMTTMGVDLDRALTRLGGSIQGLSGRDDLVSSPTGWLALPVNADPAAMARVVDRATRQTYATQPRVASRDVEAGFGNSALKAIAFKTPPRHRHSPHQRWLHDSGHGVLLDGLGEFGPSPGEDPLLEGRRGAQAGLAGTMAAAMAAQQARQESQRGVTGLAVPGGWPSASLFTGSLSPVSSPEARYDAAQAGDFASVLANGFIAPSASHPLASHVTRAAGFAQASPISASLADVEARGLEPSPQGQARGRRRHTGSDWMTVQDVQLSRAHLPALTSSLNQLSDSVERLGAMVMRGGAGVMRATGRAGRSMAHLGAMAREVAALSAQTSTRVADASEALAAFIRGDRPALGATTPGMRGDLDPWWEETLIALSSQGGALDDELRRARRALAAINGQAPAISALDQLVGPDGAQPAPAAAPVTRRLRLFSPEKTLAMLAPELESGGLLDDTSRRELSAALEDLSLSQGGRTSRRLRTAFGTLSLNLEADGQVVVEAEEISSHAPSVAMRTSTATPSTARGEMGRAQGFGAVMTAAERLLRRGAVSGALPRAVRELEVTLGQLSRAERQAGVALDPANTAEHMARLGLRQSVVRGAVEPSLRHALTELRDISAGSLVRVSADSARAARITEALAQAGITTTSPKALKSLDAQQVASVRMSASLDEVAEVVARQDMARRQVTQAAEALSNGTLSRVLGRLGQERAGLAAANMATLMREAADRPSARRLGLVAAGVETLLREAADARAVGSVGRVAMARRMPDSEMTRAEVAQLLPFMQRSTRGWERLSSLSDAPRSLVNQTREDAAGLESRVSALQAAMQQAQVVGRASLAQDPRMSARNAQTIEQMEARATQQAEALRGAADTLEVFGQQATRVRRAMAATPALGWLSGEALVSLGLSLGRSPEWSDALTRMGVGDVLELEKSWLEADQALSALPGLGLDASPWKPTGEAWSSVADQGRDEVALVEMGASASTRVDQARQARQWASRRIERLTRETPTRRAAIENAMTRTRASAPVSGVSAGPKVQPSALAGALLRELTDVEGVLRALSGDSAQRARRRAPEVDVAQDSQAGTLVEAASARVVGLGSQRGAGATLGRGRAGQAGIWSPAGVERLLQMRAEELVGSHGGFDASLVAPSLFKAQQVTRPDSAVDGLSRLSEVDVDRSVDEALRGMTLGVGMLGVSPEASVRAGVPTYDAGSPGVQVSLGAGAGMSPRWWSQSRTQAGLSRLMSSLDMAVTEGSTAAPVGVPVRASSGQGAVPDLKQVTPGASRGGPLARRMAARAERAERELSKVQGQKLSDRALFTPPSYTVDGTAGGQQGTASPLAAKGSPSGGSIEKGESGDRKGLAHQTGVPSQDDIEDIAREVLSELRRRWSYEIERRGME